MQLVNQEYGKYAPQGTGALPAVALRLALHRLADRRGGLRHVCPAIVTDQDLARWMPVYGYLITDNDIPPYAATGTVATPAGASHVGAWFLNPVSPALDANQQALQNQEVAEVTTFARTGDPTAPGTPIWPSSMGPARKWNWRLPVTARSCPSPRSGPTTTADSGTR